MISTFIYVFNDIFKEGSLISDPALLSMRALYYSHTNKQRDRYITSSSLSVNKGRYYCSMLHGTWLTILLQYAAWHMVEAFKIDALALRHTHTLTQTPYKQNYKSHFACRFFNFFPVVT